MNTAAKLLLGRSRSSVKGSSPSPHSLLPIPPPLRARKARPADAAAVHRLVSHYAAQGLLLPRSEEEIREHISRFLVLEDDGRVIGCVALETYGADLAEVRSLALDPATRGRGLGARLVQFALAEAKRRRFARVFAVTHAPEFFRRQGFARTSRHALPEKIARDCCTCLKEPCCELIAVVADAATLRRPRTFEVAEALTAPPARKSEAALVQLETLTPNTYHLRR